MKSKEKPRFSQLWPQWLAVVEVFLLFLVTGTCTGWISPFLGNLSRPNPPFAVTKTQTTWIASLMYLSRAVGIISASITMNLLGSKRTLWVGGVVNVAGWILLIAAHSIEVVFGCLLCLGFASGVTQSILGIYVSEIAYAPIRGALMGLAVQGFMVGIFLGNTLGGYLAPWAFGVVNLTIMIIFLATFFFVPQTPYHFVNKNKLDDAEKSIQWYTRGVDSNPDLEKLIKFLATSPQLSYMATLREFMKPVNLKVLLMISVTFGAIEFCGILTIIEYSEIIYIKANVTAISPATLVAITSAICIPACWISFFTVDKIGRTSMLLISCIIFFVAIGGWAVNFHLLDLGYESSSLQWIMIIGAALFRISINTGLLPVRITLIAELYAPNIKSVGSSINGITMSICVFISSKNFTSMTDYMTYKYTFYMYAGVILLVGICIKIFLPETKGKTLQEIQEMLNNRKQPEQIKNNQCDLKHCTGKDKDIPFVCTHL